MMTPACINNVGQGRINFEIYNELPDPLYFSRFDIINANGRWYINSATSISTDSWVELFDLAYSISINEYIEVRIDEDAREELHDKILIDAVRRGAAIYDMNRNRNGKRHRTIEIDEVFAQKMSYKIEENVNEPWDNLIAGGA